MSRATLTVDDAGGTGAGSTIDRIRMRGVAVQVFDSLKLKRSRLSGDHIGADGVSVTYGSLSVQRSKVRGFDSSGIDAGYYEVTIRGSTISGNGGAGLDTDNTTASVRNSTIAGNHGIGVYAMHYSDVAVLNSTLDGNCPTCYGGGNAIAFYSSSLNIRSSTIANDGRIDPRNQLDAGMGDGDDSLISVRNVAVAGAPMCGRGNIHLEGGSVIAHPGTCSVQGSDEVANPMLRPLAENGGPTKTRALKKGSPAIGHAIDPSPKTDQRGFKRDRHPDSGAYERGATR